MEKEEKIRGVLGDFPEGLTITSIVDKSGFSRSTIRTILAKMEGGGKVNIRSVGMAKLYSLRKK